jgi:hypothetical protein
MYSRGYAGDPSVGLHPPSIAPFWAWTKENPQILPALGFCSFAAGEVGKLDKLADWQIGRLVGWPSRFENKTVCMNMNADRRTLPHITPMRWVRGSMHRRGRSPNVYKD